MRMRARHKRPTVFYPRSQNHLGSGSVWRRAKIPQAEECFSQAIDTARRQHTKSLELRATISLCKLWQKIGKKKEAKSKLGKIYGWFTEGFDTPDLKQAKTLLDELA